MTKRLMMVSLSVAWVAALLCVTEVLAQAGCDPLCNSAMTPLTKTADPYDCTRYYLCLDGGIPSDISLPCPAGTSFDSGIVPPDCVGPLPCNNDCTQLTCKIKCINDLDRYTDPKNCSIYYDCLGGNILGPLECPANAPYFNSATLTCDVKPSVCCRDPCVAFCSNGQVETQDPYDCHKYYYCETAGPADETYHLSCPSGANFDVTAGICVVNAACNTLCDANPPTPDCQDTMMCTSVGFFPKCTTTCDQQYFNCQYVGLRATVDTCVGDLVFNTDSDYAYCVSPSICPFHP